MVERLSDDDIMRLNRGGHDPFKVYAAYHAAVHHNGEPTVILAKTVKGYGMGDAGEAENDSHQVKKLDLDELKHFRDRFDIPLSDKELEDIPFYRPPEDTPEMVYLRRKRASSVGRCPSARSPARRLKIPGLDAFEPQLQGHRRANQLHHHGVRANSGNPGARQEHRRSSCSHRAGRGPHVWHGGMFRQLGIYSSAGQLYEPEDSGEIAAYRESKDGQVHGGGDQRGRCVFGLAVGGDLLQHSSLHADPVLHLLLDVRFSAGGRSGLGGRRHAGPGFLLGGTAGGPRSTGRVCSIRMATATFSPPRFPTA